MNCLLNTKLANTPTHWSLERKVTCYFMTYLFLDSGNLSTNVIWELRFGILNHGIVSERCGLFPGKLVVVFQVPQQVGVSSAMTVWTFFPVIFAGRSRSTMFLVLCFVALE